MSSIETKEEFAKSKEKHVMFQETTDLDRDIDFENDK